MRGWVRLALIFAAVTLLPVIPFVLLGGDFEQSVERWFSSQHGSWWIALVTVCLLAADIFLPIPSSVICTLAGSRLGWLTAGLWCWLGLNIGSIVGYALAYRFGYPMAKRWSKPEDLQQAEGLARNYGPLTLVLTRGLPILGEAMVLVMGVYRLSWWQFFLPVAATNLGLSLAYTALGQWSAENGWLPAALGIAAALPLVPLWWLRKRIGGAPQNSEPPEDDAESAV